MAAICPEAESFSYIAVFRGLVAEAASEKPEGGWLCRAATEVTVFDERKTLSAASNTF